MIGELWRGAAGWRAWAAATGLALGLGFGAGWTVRDWRAGAERASAAEARVREIGRVLAAERARTALTHRAETEALAAQARVRTVTRTLIQEIPIHVTPAADTRCDVPAGFVRLHDSAAGGVVLSEPAPVLDDAPSGLALSAVAATVIDNYGTCEVARSQLMDLQSWVRAQGDP